MRTVPAGLSRSAVSAASSRLDLVQRGADGLHEPLAGFRRRDAAGRAGQQAQAQARLQIAHGLAQRRLRDAELRGGLGEAALARDGHESRDVVQVVSAIH